MKTKFKPSDIVQLKSGGPAMTVETVSSNYDGTIYRCSWFAGAKDCMKSFVEEALQPYVAPEK
jgi:uncharacterized protein YodC (DUF2158 family)